MKVLLTGSSGRIGRAIFGAMISADQVVGLDRNPFSTTSIVGDVADPELLRTALDGVDAIIHTASLHAPHVGLERDAEFRRINIAGLRTLVRLAREAGVRTLVYTSTTALYGDAVRPGACTWIDEQTIPRPRTIYHQTKLEAESILEAEADGRLTVRVIRMSRCFPEQADQMAAYRLHRGIDVRDVAQAHVAALECTGAPFQRFIASGATPFRPDDVAALATDARDVIAARCPQLIAAFEQRGWSVPDRIDRVYAAHAAEAGMGWRSRHGFADVLGQLDAQDIEVLPPSRWFRNSTTE